MKVPDLPAAWQKTRTRAGFASCSYAMLEVLHRLALARAADMPFIHLPDVHGRTMNSLVCRDWIVKSKGLDGIRYKITGRGLSALKIYAVPASVYDDRRFDGICPDCQVRSKHVGKSGYQFGYCVNCLRLRDARKSYTKKPGTCPRCTKRPKHITASGNVRSYCKPCRRELAKSDRKRYNAELLRRIQNEGYLKYCSACHYKTVYIAGNTVTDYCYECYREYRSSYYHRKNNAAIYTPTVHGKDYTP